MLQWPASDEQEALDGRRDILDGKSYFLQLCMAIHRLWCQVFLHAEAIISQSSYLRIANITSGVFHFASRQAWQGQAPIHFKEDVFRVSRGRFKTVILSDSEESLPGERFFAIAQNDKARWLVISNVLEASPGTLSGRQVSTIMNSHDQDQHSSSSTCPTPCHPERSEGGSQISWHTAPYSGVPPPVTLSEAKGLRRAKLLDVCAWFPTVTLSAAKGLRRGQALRCAQGDKREVTSVE